MEREACPVKASRRGSLGEFWTHKKGAAAPKRKQAHLALLALTPRLITAPSRMPPLVVPFAVLSPDASMEQDAAARRPPRCWSSSSLSGSKRGCCCRGRRLCRRDGGCQLNAVDGSSSAGSARAGTAWQLVQKL